METLPDGAAIVAGVIGQPISHSLSPFIHNAWLRALKINGIYAPFAPKNADDFEALIETARHCGLKGFNVTAPYKENALKVASTLSRTAERAGSVNLLWFDETGTLCGDSTDGLGVTRAFSFHIPHHRADLGPMTILGAGGATRAAIAAFLDGGCPEVRIVNRTVEKAESLATLFGPRVKPFGFEYLARAYEGANSVINALSAPPPLEFTGLEAGACLMDMTYKPLITPWLRAGQAQGFHIADGLQMLIEQAKPSFEAFFGVAPPEDLDIRAMVLKRRSDFV